MKSAALSREARAEALREMAGTSEDHPLDVLVIGGGVVGAGTALDAATRGLRVGVVEAGDWASGTSSRTTKLIHGGLRYLEMFDFHLVAEALRDRALLLKHLAPHLVKPMPILYPLTRRGWERPYVTAGLTLYDNMGGFRAKTRGLPHHRQLSRAKALEAFPGLNPETLTGAVQFWEGSVDDARHTMTLVRTAASHGALAANRTKAVGLLRDGERVTGATVEDLETGRQLDVRARVVINAAGVWTEEVDALAGASGVEVRASKGVHILVPREKIEGDKGLITRAGKSVLFIIPRARHWQIGTTDTDWTLDKAHPVASAADVDYLIEQVNQWVRTPISRDDIVSVYAGLRPLVAGKSADTAKLSRDHTVLHPRPGLVAVAGGKYTTYRVMAADAVDEAAKDLAAAPDHMPPAGAVPASAADRTPLTGGVPASITDRTPLAGAEGYAALLNRVPLLAVELGVDEAEVRRLLGRYGDLLPELRALIAEDPTLAEPLPGGAGHLRAEIVYAATHEGALHLDDVLTRRARISIDADDRGVEAAEPAARLVAPVLGWDEDTIRAEVDAYHARVAAELRAQEAPDDPTADRARRTATDLIPAP
ncbi:glycerol-3-phosphate dehydrogenase/oxidase [Streptomyces pathocidini]|uniref:Glycerol-3-phosphate dehydrogenase n=1 Tax=Streptomyces pathocidini TaxID=1650571 RepID=A0ABW7UP14_9ACTN|nr:glycerol-3-phosphate dehydrogenase/oxidase [Streptomyces pathocidini]